MFIKIFYLRGREDIHWLENIIDNSYQILIMSLTFDKNTPASIRFLLSKRCLDLVDCFTHHQIDKIKDKQQTQNKISKLQLLNTFDKILFNKRETKSVQKKTPFLLVMHLQILTINTLRLKLR